MTQGFEQAKDEVVAGACGLFEGGMVELGAEELDAVSGAGLGGFLRWVRESMKYVRHNNGLATEFET